MVLFWLYPFSKFPKSPDSVKSDFLKKKFSLVFSAILADLVMVSCSSLSLAVYFNLEIIFFQFFLKCFSFPANDGSTVIFTKIKLFINGWMFFRFSIGKTSGSVLKKIVFLFVLIVMFSGILELRVLLTSQSANLMFSEIFFIQFLCVHQWHTPQCFYGIDTD